MYLRLPERIPISYSFLFAGTLFLAQQLEHTAIYFSACCFLFVIVSTFGFNIAGGLTRPSGAYIFFFSTLTLILALCVKVVLGEPGDSHLIRPHLTITAYLVGVCSLSASLFVVRKLARRKALLETLVSDRNMYQAAVGCLAIGIVITVATHTVERGTGTALSALIQINHFAELSIILGTIASLRRTGGRKSVDLVVLVGGSILFIAEGLLSFSKGGFFAPLICWGVAAAAEGIRLRRHQVIVSLALAILMSRYLVPYSQYGRTLTSGTFEGNIAVAAGLLSNIGQVREIYLADRTEAISQRSRGAYYDQPEGLFDRLEMVSIDDQLIDATYTNGPKGYLPLLLDVEALVPHIFWPDKPTVMWGNLYAHEGGLSIGEDDFTTGISFSAVGEAYHLGEWTGLLVAAPIVWISTLLIFDSLCGDVRKSPWGLLAIVFFAHIAPEGYLSGLINAAAYAGFAIAFAAITTGYVMPIIGSLLVGPGKSSADNGRVILPPLSRRRVSPDPAPARYTEGT